MLITRFLIDAGEKQKLLKNCADCTKLKKNEEIRVNGQTFKSSEIT